MKTPLYRTVGSAAPFYLTNFDSASSMVRALSRYLEGEDFPGLGGMAPPLESVGGAINLLPRKAREKMYATGGAMEAVPARRLGDVDAGEIARWVVNSYPERRYPGVIVGASSGAIVHLAAALGIPWLPQTFLVAAKRKMDPDDPASDLEFSAEHGPMFLEANPDVALHHMSDPNQDRLMLQNMTYFRFKRLTLGEHYEKFLERSLEPGGTIYVSECTRTWPTTRLSDRHVFQFGALGGATEKDFFEGSERVEEYLARYGASRSRWEPPAPDGHSPEAEWGFEPALLEDIRAIAARRGWRVERIRFDEPEDPSPLVADIYREWYAIRRLKANRLFAECFFVMEPHWTLRIGAVPFWMKFNMEASADALERYLDSRDAFDEVYITLLSHGVEAVGLVSASRWDAIARRGTTGGRLIGVDQKRFPADFGVFTRYHDDIQRIPARYPIPGPLAQGLLWRMLERTPYDYPGVRWMGHEGSERLGKTAEKAEETRRREPSLV